MRTRIVTTGALLLALALSGCTATTVTEQPSGSDRWAILVDRPGELGGCERDEAVESAITPAVMPPQGSTVAFSAGAARDDVDRVLDCLRDEVGGELTVLVPAEG